MGHLITTVITKKTNHSFLDWAFFSPSEWPQLCVSPKPNPFRSSLCFKETSVRSKFSPCASCQYSGTGGEDANIETGTGGQPGSSLDRGWPKSGAERFVLLGPKPTLPGSNFFILPFSLAMNQTMLVQTQPYQSEAKRLNNVCRTSQVDRGLHAGQPECAHIQ